jgi:phosphoserine aminotransferase
MVEINIPSDLLPLDGRFGCGPSKVRPAQLAAFSGAGAELLGTSHRQAPVKNLVKRVQDGLMDLFHNPSGYEIVMGKVAQPRSGMLQVTPWLKANHNYLFTVSSELNSQLH